MIAKGTNFHFLQAAALAVDVTIGNPRVLRSEIRFTLRPNPSKRWQRLAIRTRRRVNAVCWHGHRDFFRALFMLCPTAIVTSNWVNGRLRYTADTFEQLLRTTDYGTYRDACTCSTPDAIVREITRRLGGTL